MENRGWLSLLQWTKCQNRISQLFFPHRPRHYKTISSNLLSPVRYCLSSSKVSYAQCGRKVADGVHTLVPLLVCPRPTTAVATDAIASSSSPRSNARPFRLHVFLQSSSFPRPIGWFDSNAFARSWSAARGSRNCCQEDTTMRVEYCEYLCYRASLLAQNASRHVRSYFTYHGTPAPLAPRYSQLRRLESWMQRFPAGISFDLKICSSKRASPLLVVRSLPMLDSLFVMGCEKVPVAEGMCIGMRP